MKNQILGLALTLAASTSMASTLNCSVSEIIAGSFFSQEVVVADNSTVFLKTIGGSTKGFVAYTSGQAVINMYDTQEEKASYIVTPVADGSVATLTFAPTYDLSRQTTVTCKVH